MHLGFHGRPQQSTHYSRRIVSHGALVLICSMALMGFASPAHAHGGKGIIKQVSRTSGSGSASGSVTFVVRVSFANDGENANAATVTAVLRDASGKRVGVPVVGKKLGAGKYQITVKPPAGGSWKVTFSSLNPPATLSVVG